MAFAAAYVRHGVREAWGDGPTLRDLMGHADVKTTLRYVTVTSEDRRIAIRRALGAEWTAGGQRDPGR